jgi:hypothetical protein
VNLGLIDLENGGCHLFKFWRGITWTHFLPIRINRYRIQKKSDKQENPMNISNKAIVITGINRSNPEERQNNE